MREINDEIIHELTIAKHELERRYMDFRRMQDAINCSDAGGWQMKVKAVTKAMELIVGLIMEVERGK